MKNLSRILFILAGILCSVSAFAQSLTVSGTVKDGYEYPLEGVAVIEKDTNNGVVTGSDGTYSLTLSGPEAQIEFQSLGMKTLTMPLDGRRTINVVMEEDHLGLEGTVVIGYGSVKKEEITTAITRVGSEDFIKGGVSSPMQLLQGKVAGLGIATTSGDPGNNNVSISFRGLSTLAASSSPLIVIDGIAGGSLNSISPEDIESIDVLKDGSAAAIYGTRGTNGVILITTKRPQGGKATLDYHTYVKFDRMLDNEDYPTADELREYKKDPAFAGINDFGASSDYVSEVTRQPISQMHYLSASGGTDKTSYVASLSYDEKQGIYETSYDNALAAKISISHSMLDDRLQLLLNVNDRVVKHGSAPADLYSKAVLRNPTIPIYNEDETYFENSNGANPVELLNEYDNLNQYNQLMMNGKIIIEPVKNLKLSAMAAYMNDYNMSESSSTHKAYNSVMGSEKGSARIGSGHGDDRTLELQADYSLNLDGHSFSVTGGYSYNKFVHQSAEMYAFNFPVDGFGAWNMGSAESTLDGLSTVSSYKYERKLIGFFGRANYSLMNRYLVMASLRYEGSDKFGKNNRWGLFPSISLGWRLINEPWLQNVSWLSDLKLRAGYGVTGTEPASAYQYIALYGFNNSYMSQVNGEWVSSIIPSNNPNDNLKWEEKHEYNVGLDFAFLDSRISGSVDAYYRHTKDLLYTYTVPMPPNISTQMLANVGSISNKGIELSLNFDIIRKRDMDFSISGNASYNENKLISLSNDMYTLEYLTLGNLDHVQTYSHRLEDGWAIGNFYGWETVGLKNNGTAWRIKGAENSTAGEDQKTILGNGIPKMFAGLQANFRYKGLDASVAFRGAFMYQILNQYRMKYETLAWIQSVNVPSSAYEKVGDYYNYAPSTYCDRYIEDGDYVKLDNVVIGYTFNTEKSGVIKNIRLYCAGKNLLTFTKYRGIDPEAVSITGLTPGIDSYEKYPTLRSFTFGLNIVF